MLEYYRYNEMYWVHEEDYNIALEIAAVIYVYSYLQMQTI